MKSILDPTFCYTPAVLTDIRRTFARAREQQREEAAVRAAAIARHKAETQRDVQRVIGIFNARRKGS